MATGIAANSPATDSRFFRGGLTMGKKIKALAKKGTRAVRKAYKKAESKILTATGRRVVRRKLKTAGKVGKQAAKKALVAGALAAAGVVLAEIRRSRRKA
jgi:hypothetical protein